MALFKPYKITSDKLADLPVREGQIVITTDTKKLYVDVSATERIEVTSDAEVDLSDYVTTTMLSSAIGEEASERQQQDNLLNDKIDTKLDTAQADNRYALKDNPQLTGNVDISNEDWQNGKITAAHSNGETEDYYKYVIGFDSLHRPYIAKKEGDNNVSMIYLDTNSIVFNKPLSFTGSSGIESNPEAASQTRQNIGAAAINHTHDDRYYTESEVNSKLADKANATHTHTIANVTNLQETIDGLEADIAGKAPTSHTHTTAQVSGLDTALAGKAPTNHTHNYAGSASAGGAANIAIKLQTPRQISLSEGVESVVQNFDGSSNVAIPVRKIKESYLDWGGRDIHGEISPVDMAASAIHSANRFQFADPAGITVEYSQNGTSFQSYSSIGNNEKIRLVSGLSWGLNLGGAPTPVTDTVKLRVTLDANKMKVYTRLKKLLIEVSQDGAAEFKVDIETAKRGSESDFTLLKSTLLSGWPGWNSIFFDFPFGGGDNQTSNIGAIRLTFSQKKGSFQTKNAQVLQITALGSTCWKTPSTMARTGHLYEWDISQNATFPGTITAKGFNGNAASASKVEWSGVQNKPSTFAPSAHNHDAANITSGVLNVDRVPSIPATKLTGIINQANLPSYVDDILEFANKTAFPTKGESGKIYVDQATNKTYRWSGSGYVEISASLALGTTSSTAFRGDYGNVAYTHATAKGAAFGSGLYKITTNAQGHVTTATAVTKSDITALGIPGSDTNTNTTYELTKSGSTITLEGSDGSSTSVTDSNTIYTHPTTPGNKHIPAGGSSGQILRWSADGTAAWGADNNTNTTYTLSKSGSTIKLTGSDGSSTTVTDSNTTYSAMTGATSSAAGSTGLVPAPAAGKQTSFLRGDGTWVVPTNTTYSNMTGATTSAAGKAGLVPAPAAGAATRYLRSDGTWQVPPDTNTTYTLSSFGITATAAELNKLDGVTTTATQLNYLNTLTGDVQTQLDGKAASSHSHSNYLTTSGTAAAATKLATARTFSLTGDVTGSASFNGTTNCSIAATLAANSVTANEIATGAVGLSELSSAVGTVAVQSAAPTDSHVKLWIKA